MRIIKYIQFVKENFQDPPETYVTTALQQIKTRIDSYFESSEDESEEKVQTLGDAQARGEKKEKGEKMSFKDFNLKLESSEISKYSKMYDSVTFKFTDGRYLYNLYVMIQLKDALPNQGEQTEQVEGQPPAPTTESKKDFSWKDIENCFVKFKKYDQDKNMQ